MQNILLFLIGICLFLSHSTFGQHSIRCGTDEHGGYYNLRSRPGQLQRSEEDLLQQHISQKRVRSDEREKSYVIPVVFHVFGDEYLDGTTVTDAIVKDALQKTNEDFQGLTPDWNTIDSPFDTIKSAMDITFKLARIDPNGNPTTGILYYAERSGFGEGIYDYIDEEIQRYAWDNYKYMNVYIMLDLRDDDHHFNSGVAWYPQTSMSDDNLARVVYNGSFLGDNTDENQRSVLTHEFGHWLDLRHTFEGGCSEENDLVDDTPAQEASSEDTRCAVIYGCNEKEEVNNENFMDYTECYKMFTKGQVKRMDAALQLPSRVTLWQESNLIATGVQGFNEKPSLVLTSSVFEEVKKNDGSIGDPIEIKCVGCTFSKTGLFSEGSDYAVSNLPAGLTARIEVVADSTTAVVTLTDKATAHEQENSITNLEIRFMDQAVSGSISELYSDRVKGIKIFFLDVYTSYCLPKIRFVTYSHITNFTFNNVSFSSEFEEVVDFSDLKILQVRRNRAYDVSITLNEGAGRDFDKTRVRIWADWDQNFIYGDDELVVSEEYTNDQSDENGSYEINTSITVPSTALSGNTQMRVFVHYVQGDKGDDACDKVVSGESEDYGLRIYADDQPFTIDFAGGPGFVNLSDPVSFLDLSVVSAEDEVVTWAWEFPGGVPATSNEQNPRNVIYPSAGTHDVTLTITTKKGEVKSKTVPDMITSALNYCYPFSLFKGYFNVTHLELNTIDHNLDSNNFWNYFDIIDTDLRLGKTYPVSLTVNRGAGSVKDRNRVRMWADWNRNSRFDGHELLLSEVVSSEDYDEEGNHIINGEIKVPLNAVQAKVGLRVMGHFMQDKEGDQPCDVIESGNAADYALNIISTLTIANAIAYRRVTSNFSPITLDLAPVFTDANEDALTYTAVSSNTDVVTVVINSSDLVITYAGLGTSTITVTATDINGETVDDAFDITVIAVPVITSPATASVEEGSTEITKVTATDADSDDLIYSISGGADQALFSINRTSGALAFQTAPNFENPNDQGRNNGYIVEVMVSDGTTRDTQTITVTVTDVNDNSPVITSPATASVEEGSTEITKVTATDADSDDLIYSISGGADRALFSINRTSGALTFQTAPNFENPADKDSDNRYEVAITVNDGTTRDTQTITITVTDVNDNSPMITSSATPSAIEGTTEVLTVTATDADSDGLTYSISGGADRALFRINRTSGALTFETAPDFEASGSADNSNVYEVEVTASDGTNSASQTITVTVTNDPGDDILGFSDSEEAAVIFPNPSGDYLEVRSPVRGTFQLLSLSGKPLLEGTANTKLDITSLQSGLYLVQLPDGRLLKFVRE